MYYYNLPFRRLLIYVLLEADPMKVSYDKLWKLLIDNKMKKSDLAKAAQIS